MTLPDVIESATAGYERAPLVRRTYQASVTFLEAPARPSLILKSAPGLAGEANRLDWLVPFIPVPRVIAFGTDDDGADHIVMSRLEGVDGTDAHDQMPLDTFVRELGTAMRCFHEIPAAGCPFDMSTDRLLGRAEDLLAKGEVRTEHLSPIYAGETVDNLLRTIQRLRQDDDGPPVVGHGDPSLPNMIFQDGTVTGYIDVGLAGLSDRWRDIAIVTRSLAWNIGARWIRPFCEAYGVEPDHRRIRFWTLMDEFLMSRGWVG